MKCLCPDLHMNQQSCFGPSWIHLVTLWPAVTLWDLRLKKLLPDTFYRGQDEHHKCQADGSRVSRPDLKAHDFLCFQELGECYPVNAPGGGNQTNTVPFFPQCFLQLWHVYSGPIEFSGFPFLASTLWLVALVTLCNRGGGREVPLTSANHDDLEKREERGKACNLLCEQLGWDYAPSLDLISIIIKKQLCLSTHRLPCPFRRLPFSNPIFSKRGLLTILRAGGLSACGRSWRRRWRSSIYSPFHQNPSEVIIYPAGMWTEFSGSRYTPPALTTLWLAFWVHLWKDFLKPTKFQVLFSK